MRATELVYAVSRTDRAGIDAEECQGADKGVGGDLERQRGEGLAVVGLADDALGGFFVRAQALNVGHISGRRQIHQAGIKQSLHSFVLEGGAAQHGDNLTLDGADAQASDNFLFAETAFGKVFFQQLVVTFGGDLDNFLVLLFAGVQELGRDFTFLKLAAQAVFKPANRLHSNQVDYTDKIGLVADGHMERNRTGPEAFAHLDDDVVEVGTHTVHLVDKGKARHAVAVGLTPYRLRLGLGRRRRRKRRQQRRRVPAAIAQPLW